LSFDFSTTSTKTDENASALQRHEQARHGRHLLFFDVLLDGCRGIELDSGDIGRALDEMKRAGAVFVKSSDL